MREAARRYSIAAVETLAHLMLHAKNEAVRAVCADKLLDRGFGKVKQTSDVEQQGRSLEQILMDIAAAREAKQAQERVEGGRQG